MPPISDEADKLVKYVMRRTNNTYDVCRYYLEIHAWQPEFAVSHMYCADKILVDKKRGRG